MESKLIVLQDWMQDFGKRVRFLLLPVAVHPSVAYM